MKYDYDLDNLNTFIYNNIQTLLRMNDVSISDLESAISVSKGYISRTNGGNKCLSINVCCNIANYFRISVEDLISHDYYKDYNIQLKQKRIDELQKEIDSIRRDMKKDTKRIEMKFVGFNQHDSESWYECPDCGKRYGSWGFVNGSIPTEQVTETVFGQEYKRHGFTCTCGARLYEPK